MRQSSYTIMGQQKDIRYLAGMLYQNINIKVAKTVVTSKLVKGVLPAGTIVNNVGAPSNDANAFGVVFNDVDFNDSKGTEILSVCIFGFLSKARIKEYTNEEPTAEAIKSLNMIKFL